MKRLVFSFILLLSFVGAWAEGTFRVTYKGLTDGTRVYLQNFETNTMLDSAEVKGGQVTFESKYAEPFLAALVQFNPKRTVVMEFVTDEVGLVADDAEMTAGSELNRHYFGYQLGERRIDAGMKAIYDEFNQLYQSAQGQIPQEKMEDIQRRYGALSLESDSLSRKLMTENRENLIPLSKLIYSAEDLGYDYVGEYLKTYAFADRESLGKLKATLEKEAAKLPGAKVIDFEMQDLKGNTVRLTDWVGKGNYVLVDFWASWCGPCRAEMPTVKAAYEKYHPMGFEIVGVSFDRTKEAWERGVKDLGITWPQMSDLKYWQCLASSLYNIRAIPATILFAPDGTVVKSGLRGEELTKKLAEIYEQK